MKYRFQYIGQGKEGVICEFERWDVKEMAKNSHDWKPLDDITDILLDDLAPEIKANQLARIHEPEVDKQLPQTPLPPEAEEQVEEVKRGPGRPRK